MVQYGPAEWWYPNGALAINQRAAVFGPGDNNVFAAIYADAGLTVPLPNPTTTDALGELEFFAAPGTYWIFVGPVGTGDSVQITLGADPGNPVLTVNGEGPDGGGNVEIDAADVGADPAGAAAAAAAASQPLATIDAPGDLYVGTGNNTTTRLPLGAPGEVLTVAGGTASWEPASGGGAVDSVNGQTGVVVLDATDVGADPAGSAAAAAAASQPIGTINAKGDLYAGTADNATARRSIGPDGTVLTASAADPTGMAWQVPASAPVTSVNGETGAVLLDAGDVGADPAGSAAAVQALALLKAQNLGDLPAPATARTNLGLGTAAVTNTGTGPTNAILGDDARLTDARTPTAHAITHAAAGSDPVTLDQSQVTGLAAALAAKAPATRTLTAGIALSGGGDLSADRTFDVDLGTTAGTAAEGNDSRITGAQQRSALTTKGDLYIATAASTVTRLGAGTNGHVLTADSSTSEGAKWAAAPGATTVLPGALIPSHNRRVYPGGGVTFSVASIGNNNQYFLPISVDRLATWIGLEAEISGTVGEAGSVLWAGYYAADASTGVPTGTPVASFGNVAATSTGFKTWAFSVAAVPGVQLYASLIYQGATGTPIATLRRIATAPGHPAISSSAALTTGGSTCYVQTGVTANPPSSPVGTITPNIDCPRLGLTYTVP